ncbi:hypothetical protein NLX86_08675 [Streptomyces sp. A3M-1-3]|uniref:hypothetical protein n=1 Tax=Streptomyces sp. A3M-1-3 TaxID=2962044 RepID=UPI0020B7CEE3|nr:hypothetical protein [Streptomyces sp. A3M-1-3]MCP3818185.1 hypothetical protein [Streptomyces sp. A3M-1-3]
MTSFSSVRADPSSAPRADVRTLQQRSRAHGLTVVRPGAEVVYDEESWSSRAARVRQTSRAGRIVGLAVAGETAAARTAARGDREAGTVLQSDASRTAARWGTVE